MTKKNLPVPVQKLRAKTRKLGFWPPFWNETRWRIDFLHDDRA
jgi:hypothetical protein